MNRLFYCNIEQIVLNYVWRVMNVKLTKREEMAFQSAGEPQEEPDYTDAMLRLMRTLTPGQADQLSLLLDGFGELVRYERRWYFHKGYRAAKEETE